jgi:hypothetical protein
MDEVEDQTTPRRPADIVTHAPLGRYVLVGRQPGQVVLWDHGRCVCSDAVVAELLDALSPHTAGVGSPRQRWTDAQRTAIWEFVLGGPSAVQQWGELPRYLRERVTRSELGLIVFNTQLVQPDDDENTLYVVYFSGPYTTTSSMASASVRSCSASLWARNTGCSASAA